MKQTQRLDKVLAHSGFGTRSEIKLLVKQGIVIVNGKMVKDSGLQVNPETDHIEVGDKKVNFQTHVYLMLNKPQGVISATEDSRERTVIDLLDASYGHLALFPVGRLDKDTEGLLLLTNDGKLAHSLLSPNKHVAKTYYAEVAGKVDYNDQQTFSRGVELDDGYVTMPAQLIILKEGDPSLLKESKIELTIMEGKFHQVKRMFEAVGKKVTYLKRISMGSLRLDEYLALGDYRTLTDEELQQLRGDKQLEV
ncbi:MAG: pseudouridine synthase [Bacilli bacterium]|nr:pseudouridine synthase [Bacilli bacterium]